MTTRYNLSDTNGKLVAHHLLLFLEQSDYILDARLSFLEHLLEETIPKTSEFVKSDDIKRAEWGGSKSFLSLYTQSSDPKIVNAYIQRCRDIPKMENDLLLSTKYIVMYSVRRLLSSGSLLPDVKSTYSFETPVNQNNYGNQNYERVGLQFDADLFYTEQAILHTRFCLNKHVLLYLDVLVDNSSKIWEPGFVRQHKEWSDMLDKESKLLQYGTIGQVQGKLMYDRVNLLQKEFEKVLPMTEMLKGGHDFHRWLVKFQEILQQQNDVLAYMLLEAVSCDSNINRDYAAILSNNKRPTYEDLQKLYEKALERSVLRTTHNNTPTNTYSSVIKQLLQDQRVLLNTPPKQVPRTPWRDYMTSNYERVIHRPTRPLFFDAAMGTDSQAQPLPYGVSFGGALWQYLIMAFYQPDFQRTRALYNLSNTLSTNVEQNTENNKESSEVCTPFWYPERIIYMRNGTTQDSSVLIQPYIQNKPLLTKRPENQNTENTNINPMVDQHAKGGDFFDFLYGNDNEVPQAEQSGDVKLDDVNFQRCNVTDSLFLHEFISTRIWPAPQLNPPADHARRYYSEASKPYDNKNSNAYSLHPTHLLALYTTGGNVQTVSMFNNEEDSGSSSTRNSRASSASISSDSDSSSFSDISGT